MSNGSFSTKEKEKREREGERERERELQGALAVAVSQNLALVNPNATVEWRLIPPKCGMRGFDPSPHLQLTQHPRKIATQSRTGFAAEASTVA